VRRQGQYGLSLIETIVAIALLGVIVVAVLAAFSAASITAARHQEQATLDLLARSDAEYIKSQAYDVAYANLSATGYAFAATVLYYDPGTNTFAVGNPDQGLEQIQLTVTGPSGSQEKLYFLKVQP